MLDNRGQSPKLKEYFNGSSFLNQQEEIGIFIDNFPVIKLNQLSSINNLIALLIKQNQLLGVKCQEDISLLRQSYSKHQTLLRNAREYKQENNKIEAQLQQLRQINSTLESKLQSNSKIRQLNHDIESKYKQKYKQLEEINQNLVKVVHSIAKKEYKKTQTYCKNGDTLKPYYQDIEAYCKEMRRKDKLIKNLQQSTRQFSNRLIQIIHIIPINQLANQLEHEVNGFLDLLAGIFEQLNKNKSDKENMKSSKMMGSLSHNYFEVLLEKAIEISDNSVRKEQIAIQLDEIKKEFKQSKEYYQQMVKKLQMETQKQRITQSELLQNKEEDKLNKKYQQCFNENTLLLTEVRTLKDKLEDIQLDKQKLERQISNVKNQIQSTLEIKQKTKQELLKVSQIQINMKEVLMQQLEDKRKKEKEQLEDNIKDIKNKIKEKETEYQILSRQNKQLIKKIDQYERVFERKDQEIETLKQKNKIAEKQIQTINHQLIKKTKQIEITKENLQQSQHQKNLQISYIQQLQKKISSLQNKIHTYQNKKINDASSKKQLTSLKSSLAAEKKHAMNVEDIAQQQKQQNQRLRSIIHEMKKELEHVYLKINELKQIEDDRERLILQSQKSARFKDQLLRNYQSIKLEMLRVQSENKGLSLEVKHYKSALSRIEGL